jgi:hypothetical protein
MKDFWHTLHSCGHSVFWTDPNVAADMHLRQPCPWCKTGEKDRVIFRDPRSRIEARASEYHGTDQEVDAGESGLYHHRKDERCCIIRIAATIGANESNDRE